MRFEERDTCSECDSLGMECEEKRCSHIWKNGIGKYNGMRLTSDGFDCALPVAIDSHSHCAYNCLYCFSDNIVGHAKNVEEKEQIGRQSLSFIEGVFSGESQSKRAKILRKALKYDDRNEEGYPAPVQLGAICDPCDSIEQQDGWLLDFLDIAIEHRQPVRISTKGIIFLLDEYMEKLKKAPELFWVAFSIITSYDDVIEKTDEKCPVTSKRLELMEKLSEIGISTSLRFRPMTPGVSDHKQDPDRLIRLASNAGAKAVSFEVLFYPTRLPEDKKKDWKKMNMITGLPLKKVYSQFGSLQSCTRPAYTWTEPIMHRVHEKTLEHGMTPGVSDPAWKQLTGSGCCCGILPDDPVFGNWERENATNAVFKAHNREDKKEITIDEVIPPWAPEQKLSGLVHVGVGPKHAQEKRYKTCFLFLEKLMLVISRRTQW